MTINYGKRNSGGLTASSPGDTLYIPLQFYNDSGASISIGATLTKTDIEVFKNGGVVERATDSGYAVLGDTGNFDSRIGFKGISVQIFNTADDTGFYDVGSQYWVAIDAVTVDSRTVRFFPAVFEVGEPRANIVQIAGDTGAATHVQQIFANGFNDTGINNRLAVILADTDTGIQSGVTVTAFSDTGVNERLAALETGVTVTLLSDTGAVSRSVWDSLRSAHIGSGSFGESDTGINNRLAVIAADTDTGIKDGVWDAAIRTLTAFAHDTGVASTVWKSQHSDYDADTGSMGYAVGNILELRGDTGAAQHFQQLVQDGFADTGINERLTALETGVTVTLLSDTGSVSRAIWNSLRADHTTDGTFGHRVLGDIKAVDGDTGAADIIGKAFADTGYVLRGSVEQIDGDTGAAAHLASAFSTNAGVSDTGLVANAAAVRAQTDKLTFDTGNELHADVRKVNNVTVGGTGSSGNEWGPAS